jgi:hypothetical protein
VLAGSPPARRGAPVPIEELADRHAPNNGWIPTDLEDEIVDQLCQFPASLKNT